MSRINIYNCCGCKIMVSLPKWYRCQKADKICLKDTKYCLLIGLQIIFVSFLKRYDLSLSEVIRLALCIEFNSMIPYHYPKPKCKVSRKQFALAHSKVAKNKRLEEEHHKLISKIYF